MPATKMTKKRSYGTGALREKRDSGGRVSYYGQWRSDGVQLKRRIGPKRVEATTEGLTKPQAERALQRLMAEVKPTPRAPIYNALTIAELGARYLVHLEKMKGRKKSTRVGVESPLRVHFVPFFEDRGVATITREEVEDLRTLLEAKLCAKSVHNYMGTLSAMFKYATSRKPKLASLNPCEDVELPEVAENDEIRFLTLEEVEAVVRHAQPGVYEALDRAMYRTAAMTGVREGELIALRWCDIDWTASAIRVHQNFVLDEFGTPKSKRSFRAVPMARQVAAELERYYKAKGSPDEHLLVFGEPEARLVLRGNHKGKTMPAGTPLNKAAILRRFRRALEAAQVRQTALKFHELRHTFGTQMAAAGVPMRTLQEWMGHRDIKTTERYVHYAPKTRDAQLVEAAFSQDTGAASAPETARAPLGVTI